MSQTPSEKRVSKARWGWAGNAKRRGRRAFRGRLVRVKKEVRWTQDYSRYDRERLAAKHAREEKWVDEHPGEERKKRRTSYKAIAARRHRHFTEGAGRHGIGVTVKRVEKHLRRFVVANQYHDRDLLTKDADGTLPKLVITKTFLEGIVARVEAEFRVLLERGRDYAAHRQKGRSKNAAERKRANPSYMLKMIDMQAAWANHISDARNR